MIVNKEFVETFFSAYKDVKNIFEFEKMEESSDGTYRLYFGLNRLDKTGMRDIILAELVDGEEYGQYYSQYNVYVISPVDKSFVKIGTQIEYDFFFNEGSSCSLFY